MVDFYQHNSRHPDDLMVRILVRFAEDPDEGTISHTYLFSGEHYKTRDIDIKALENEIYRVFVRFAKDIDSIKELLITAHCNKELIAELREQLRNPELLRDTTRDYQEPDESFKALIEHQRNRFAAVKTYTELCEASKDYKRMRDEWAEASADAWDVNLRRVLPKLGE